MSEPRDLRRLRDPLAATPVELPTLHAGGFGASVDALAWEPEPDPEARRMRLWFVSLLGAQQAVKALWARLLKGETATVRWEALGRSRFCALAPEGPRTWRFLTASQPASAGYQGLLLPEAAVYGAERADFLLLPPADADIVAAAQLHYRYLNRRVDLPLHPAWSAWLWERAQRIGEAVPLEAHGIRAYRCAPDVARLAGDLSAAVRRGELTVPADATSDEAPGVPGTDTPAATAAGAAAPVPVEAG